MDRQIGITAELVDAQRCKFIVTEPVYAAGVRRFESPEEAAGSPLAEALFGLPGLQVRELIASGNLVTVVTSAPTTWQAVGRSIGTAIRAALTSEIAPFAAEPTRAPSRIGDDELYERVHDL